MANPEHEAALRTSQSSQSVAVDLRGYDLAGILFPAVRLEGADLRDADLSKAELSGGYFKNSNLSGAKLRKARVTTADFRNANLSRADLTACDLNSSVLSGANLAGANLTKASLVRARADGVDFTGASLDKTDLRGAKGVTGEQLASALHGDKAILDEPTLIALGRQGNQKVARHGRPVRKRRNPNVVDLLFQTPKPGLGDLFLICGYSNPDRPATGDHGFAQLADLGFEQVDDYFGICIDGDPVIWLFPLFKGEVVEHHPGPLDGLRLELTDGRHADFFQACIARMRETLHLETTG